MVRQSVPGARPERNGLNELAGAAGEVACGKQGRDC
jgi:hypothetical protein